MNKHNHQNQNHSHEHIEEMIGNCCKPQQESSHSHNDKGHAHKHDCCHDNMGDMGGHDHSHHNHGGMGGHGSPSDFLRRFWIVTALLIPLVLANKTVASFLGLPALIINKWIQFILATIIFGFSLIFFKHAGHEIKSKRYGMMTLVSLAVGAGYLFSVASTLFPALHTEFYLEIATLIWVLLFGHYLEARSGAAAGNALNEVAKLLPDTAHRLKQGQEEDVSVKDLKEGDTVIVKPGEKIPADGQVVSGNSHVNEALVSGEAKPISKKEGSTAIAGSIVLDGALTIRLTRVGSDSTVGKIQQLINSAQATKPESQQLADRAAGWLTFIAVGASLLTLLIWSLVIGQTLTFSLTLAITVLVITCPHALGLAIPTVTTIATSLAVKNGVFIKNLAKIETVKKADYIMFDKTGTLTTGEFGVQSIKTENGMDKNELLRLAASLEQYSSHIIGQAIVKKARKQELSLNEATDFQNIAGLGLQAKIGNNLYYVGNAALMADKGIEVKIDDNGDQGRTTVLVSDNKKLLGRIYLSDEIKPESLTAIKNLHDLGIKVAILTGDNKQVAERVAAELKADVCFSEVMPEDKYKHVHKLQEQGHIVLMVGDGVNDAPALTQADVGLAIGAGTDVAIESGDIVLTRSNPADVVRLVILSRKVYNKMIQNLIWALGYNIIAIPAAAGIFAFWGFFLRPEIGALVMSLSTVIVVANAMLLKRIDLNHIS